MDMGDIDVAYNFELTGQERQIAAIPHFAFRDAEGNELAILQPNALFDIIEEDWPRLIQENGDTILPAYLLQHLAVIATGFARGVLHEKFSREPAFAGVMLPIIPVINYITEDLVFSEG